MGVTDKFADEFLQLQVDLMRVEAGTRRQIIGLLKKLEIDLVAQIERFDLEGVKRTSFKFKRLDALLQQTRATISTAYKGKAKLMSTSLVDIAKMQSKALPRIFERVLGGSVLTTALPPGDLRQLVKDMMIRGAPSRDWWAKQGTDLQQSFMAQMRMGVAGGETNQQLVARLRGAATGRRRVIELANGKKRIVPEFSGGIMDLKTREAEALVRTSVQSISNNVIEETYQNNQDVLKGREWLSTLDDRTTPFCIAHDGGAWDFDGNPLPESTIQVPFPGVPPDESHWGCRSTLIPITKSWDELAEMSGSKVRGIRESIADSERASMDGRVSGRLKYSEWLKAKDATDPAAVRSVLGPGRYKLWKEGKITTAQLIDQTGRPLTVKQLEALKGGPKLKPPPVQPKLFSPPSPPSPLPLVTSSNLEEAISKARKEYKAAFSGGAEGPELNAIRARIRSLEDDLAAAKLAPEVTTPRPVTTKGVSEGKLAGDLLEEQKKLRAAIDRGASGLELDNIRENIRVLAVELDDLREAKTPTLLKAPQRAPKPTATSSVRAENAKQVVAEFERVGREWLDVAKAQESLSQELLEATQGVKDVIARVRIRDKFLARIDALDARIDAIRAEQHGLLRQLIKGDATSKANIRLSAGRGTSFSNSATAAKLKDARAFLDAVVPATDAPIDIKLFVRANQSGRAHAVGNDVTLYKNSATKTYVHEIGHVLERSVPGWQEKVLRFRTARHAADSRGVRPLSTMKARGDFFRDFHPGNFLKSGEVAVEDKWLNPYMGMVYAGDSLSTEVLSMGLEMLYGNPARLLQQDPEFFEFLIDLLKSVPR